MKSLIIKEPTEIDRREWVFLHELYLPTIKAKIDPGAKTSALHTYHIETSKEGKKSI